MDKFSAAECFQPSEALLEIVVIFDLQLNEYQMKNNQFEDSFKVNGKSGDLFISTCPNLILKSELIGLLNP